MSHSIQPETRQNPARFAPLEPARQIGVAARRSPTPRDKSSVGAHADVFESAAAVKSSSGPPRFGGATAAPLAEPASSGVQLASSGRLREHSRHDAHSSRLRTSRLAKVSMLVSPSIHRSPTSGLIRMLYALVYPVPRPRP